MINLLVILLITFTLNAFSEKSECFIVLNNGDTIFSTTDLLDLKKGFIHYAKENKGKSYKVAFADVKYYKIRGRILVAYHKNEKKTYFYVIHAFNSKYFFSGHWITNNQTGQPRYYVDVFNREYKKVGKFLFTPRANPKNRLELINKEFKKFFPDYLDLIGKLISNVNNGKNVFEDINYYNCGNSVGFIE